jgi:hypothetical protein
MNLDLVNKLAKLTFYGFYDPSKGLVTVHFFNEQEQDRPDIIAYLHRDMSWDVREITAEKSTLYDDYEEVIISHKKISIEPHGSDFDKIVRSGLEAFGKQMHGDDVVLEEKDRMFRVLKNNDYKDN